MSAPHHYKISPKDPWAHLFEISVTVAEPDLAGQVFTIPAWIPGSYMIRDMARNVVSIRAEADGEEVRLTKLDKTSWQADPGERPLTLVAEVHALDLNVRGAYLDTTHGFFDGACVFPAVVGQEDRECRLDIVPPPGNIAGDWRVATSMRRLTAEQYEFGSYVASNYEELIDHPCEMGSFHIGEFDVAGIPHAIAVYGEMHFDMARLCHDLSRICASQVEFLGRPKNLDRYLFLLTVKENGYGGLEHGWSTSLMCSRKDLPRRGETRVGDDYRKLLGLCSHEYFHLWNIKRMKPEQFTPYALGSESYTGLLWVFEGITSYYDDLFLVRAGLITEKSYLELLARTITRVERTRGRFRQTVEESSFDAWTRFYKQDASSSNSIISYYSKGSLIALALDLTIRNDTNGAFSLDDVMKACWSKYGETGKGMPERGLESIARAITGLELVDFFDRFVRGTGDLPLQGLLRTIGIEMRLRQAADSKDMGGKPADKEDGPPPWLGAALAKQGAVSSFALVHAGSPAEQAGIAPGDEAVAIDGLRLTADNLDSRLRDHHEGDSVTITVFRDHNLMRHRVTLAPAPEDTCYLVLDSDVGSAVAKARERWLGQA
jgi:predicted metalloprotease with PDZ domain